MISKSQAKGSVEGNINSRGKPNVLKINAIILAPALLLVFHALATVNALESFYRGPFQVEKSYPSVKTTTSSRPYFQRTLAQRMGLSKPSQSAITRQQSSEEARSGRITDTPKEFAPSLRSVKQNSEPPLSEFAHDHDEALETPFLPVVRSSLENEEAPARLSAEDLSELSGALKESKKEIYRIHTPRPQSMLNYARPSKKAYKVRNIDQTPAEHRIRAIPLLHTDLMKRMGNRDITEGRWPKEILVIYLMTIHLPGGETGEEFLVKKKLEILDVAFGCLASIVKKCDPDTQQGLRSAANTAFTKIKDDHSNLLTSHSLDPQADNYDPIVSFH